MTARERLWAAAAGRPVPQKYTGEFFHHRRDQHSPLPIRDVLRGETLALRVFRCVRLAAAVSRYEIGIALLYQFVGLVDIAGNVTA
jgi:hypothetical protein